MIYIDTSVVLAALFAESRRAPDTIWGEPLLSSRLLQYELWTRVHGRKVANTHGEAARQVLARISMVEMSPLVLARALEPFPIPVRTLDALHLATLEFLVRSGQRPMLATFDERMHACAKAMGFGLAF